MENITYDMIKSIIIKEEINAQNMINLEFKTDDMDAAISTVAVIMPDQDEIMKNAMKMAGKSAAVNAVASGLGAVFGGALGSATSKLGSYASQAAAGNPADLTKTEVTDEKKQSAILQAFKNLQALFRYDETEKKWKKA